MNLQTIHPAVPTIVRVFLVITACLWLSALRPDRLLGRALAAFCQRLRGWLERWRKNRSRAAISRFSCFPQGGGSISSQLMRDPRLAGADIESLLNRNSTSSHADYYLHPKLVAYLKEKYRDDASIRAIVDHEVEKIVAAKSLGVLKDAFSLINSSPTYKARATAQNGSASS